MNVTVSFNDVEVKSVKLTEPLFFREPLFFQPLSFFFQNKHEPQKNGLVYEKRYEYGVKFRLHLLHNQIKHTKHTNRID